MSYTLWYSCYIDLFKAHGVGSTFIEKDGFIVNNAFMFREQTTINELNLLGMGLGLSLIPDNADVRIVGNSKYCDQSLKKLSSWIKKDEVDFKSHSQLLKIVWSYLLKKADVTSEYFTSRRSDPMLWPISKASAEHYKIIQYKAVDRMCFQEDDGHIFRVPLKKEIFLKSKFEVPFTALQLEKLIQAKKLEQKEEHQLGNLIQFPGRLDDRRI